MTEKTLEGTRYVESAGLIRLTIEPKSVNLGGMEIKRALPIARQRMVGPFIFFDHFGPTLFKAGHGANIKPHPHIGLATLTYLFDGEMIHRDSLGVVQKIRPGAVNLMTAGRGVVHSERAGDDLDRNSILHGLQVWLALPQALEDCEPEFQHFAANDIPRIELNGVQIRIVAGAAFGHHSPVETPVSTLLLDMHLPTSGSVEVPLSYPERAFYVVDGQVRVGTRSFSAGKMAIMGENDTVTLRADEPSHVIVIGGVNIGERFIDWNFVSSRKARIEKARRDWQDGNFKLVPGDDEFVPLPK